LLTLNDLTDVTAGNEPRADLARWCDANEILLVRSENERRAHRAATREKNRK